MDYLPEPHQQKEEIIDHKKEVKNYTKDIPSEDSSKQAKTRNKQEQSSDNGTPEILASIEISDGANKRPFRGVGLLNKSQLKLASYIKQNKNVTLEGTKRFMDKSGEYYLKNIQLQNKRKDNNRKSLNKPQNLENCLNKKDFNKIKRKASKIVTLLPENSLTPIPKKKDVKDNTLANQLRKKELDEAKRTAVFIRRMEYSTSMKRQQNEDNKSMKEQAKKIALIQNWWKTMFKVIKIQKFMRGFIFRKKLMKNLEHQEKLLQSITEFDNTFCYIIFKRFMDNLKEKIDYEKAKLMEKCEDFNEKLDNLEKMHNYKNLINCFKKWKDDTKENKKQALDNLANKLKDILSKKEKEDKKNGIDKIKEKGDDEENKLNDKINNFKENQAKKKFFNDLKKLHKLNKDLKNKEILKDNINNWKNINDEINKRKKILDKLKRFKENELKKKKEENRKKLVISSRINYFEVLSDKKNQENNNDNLPTNKENQIFISPQNEFNFLMEPQKKFLLSKNNQSFSLIAPENIKFKKGEPLNKSKKLDNHIVIQLDNVISFLKNKENEKEKENDIIILRKKNSLITIKSKDNDKDKKLKDACNKLNEILEKAKDESDKKLKKYSLNRFKRYDNLVKLSQKLEDFIHKKLKKDTIDNLKPKETFENNENNNNGEKEDNNNINIIKPFSSLRKLFKEITYKQMLFKTVKKEEEIKENQEENKVEEIKEKPEDNNADELKEMPEENKVEELKENQEDNNAEELKEKQEDNNAEELKEKQEDNNDDEIKETPEENKVEEIKENQEDNNADEIKETPEENKVEEIKEKPDDSNVEELKENPEDNKVEEIKEKPEDINADELKEKPEDNYNNKIEENNEKNEDNKAEEIKEEPDNINKIEENKEKNEDNNVEEIKEELENNNKKEDNNFDEIKEKSEDDNKIDENNEKIEENKIKEINEEFEDNNKKENNNLDEINEKPEDNNKIEEKPLDDDFDENKIEIYHKKNILFTIKKDEISDDNNNEKNLLSPKKRIAYRRSPKKSKNKRYLKKALYKWKINTSLMNNNDLLNKYRRKVLQDLLKIYKKGQNSEIKKYFDKWKNTEDKKEEDNGNNEPNEEIMKYKKKPRMEYKDDIIEEYDQETIKEKDSFKPTYYLPKQNIYNQIFEKPKIDESIHEPVESNINIDKEKVLPYIKKYGQRNYKNIDKKEYIENPTYNYEPDQMGYYQKIPSKKNLRENKKIVNNNNIINNNNNYQLSDTSSEESFLSGMTLIQNAKEIKEPRNYTSQSFFIDKQKENGMPKPKNDNNINQKEIYKINQIPNIMKGDFENFIDQNPKIFEKKNPRIQVTRATCDLSNIIENGNNDMNNNNKVLSNIVQKCDYDLYANQKSKSKKDKWYSMSIPLNQLKQVPDYKKQNKNEMTEKNENDKVYYNYKTIKPIFTDNKNKNGINNYTLQEMNCSQYYKSPMRNIKRNKYGDKFQINEAVIKIPGKQRRNIHQSLSPLDTNRRRNNYIEDYI